LKGINPIRNYFGRFSIGGKLKIKIHVSSFIQKWKYMNSKDPKLTALQFKDKNVKNLIVE
jgi:hypothetical protein